MTQPPKIDRGKIVVAAIFTLALGLAIFAWYWRWQHGHRAAEYWGRDTLLLIRSAPQAELLVLQPAGEEASDGESLEVDGRAISVATKVGLANVPGLIHARHSLTEDASYVRESPQDECVPHWTHALRLKDSNRSATLLFDFDCQQIRAAKGNTPVRVVPRISDGWATVFERALAASSDGKK